MPPIPPFIQFGDDGARFHALAYCRGAYGTSEPRDEPVFLVLYFCTDPAYTRYSQHIVGSDGRCYSYTRGFDERDTAEYALMCAWDDVGVSPATWRLFPLAAILEDAWTGDSEVRAAYTAARGDFCRIVYPFRLRAGFPYPPDFHPDPDFVPPSMIAGEPSEETREIFQAVADAARSSLASDDESGV